MFSFMSAFRPQPKPIAPAPKIPTNVPPPHSEFHNKTFNDFKEGLGSLRAEMEARFNSKDEIINSLAKVVRTLQDTLRHPM